jgi:hypothetical protein
MQKVRQDLSHLVLSTAHDKLEIIREPEEQTSPKTIKNKIEALAWYARNI